ncbi:hypothetical protein [Pedobacter sp. NJ-S-72]
MKKMFFISALFYLTTGCTDLGNDNFIKFQDTIGIINCAIKDKSFQAQISPQTKTLIVIKNKYYQDNWPQQIGILNVVYEREKPEDSTAILSGEHRFYRIEYLEINKKNGDIAILSLNTKVLLNYHVTKGNNNNWKVNSVSLKQY